MLQDSSCDLMTSSNFVAAADMVSTTSGFKIYVPTLPVDYRPLGACMELPQHKLGGMMVIAAETHTQALQHEMVRRF